MNPKKLPKYFWKFNQMAKFRQIWSHWLCEQDKAFKTKMLTLLVNWLNKKCYLLSSKKNCWEMEFSVKFLFKSRHLGSTFTQKYLSIKTETLIFWQTIMSVLNRPYALVFGLWTLTGFRRDPYIYVLLPCLLKFCNPNGTLSGRPYLQHWIGSGRSWRR